MIILFRNESYTCYLWQAHDDVSRLNSIYICVQLCICNMVNFKPPYIQRSLYYSPYNPLTNVTLLFLSHPHFFLLQLLYHTWDILITLILSRIVKTCEYQWREETWTLKVVFNSRYMHMMRTDVHRIEPVWIRMVITLPQCQISFSEATCHTTGISS